MQYYKWCLLPSANPVVVIILESFCLINSLNSAGLKSFKLPECSISEQTFVSNSNYYYNQAYFFYSVNSLVSCLWSKAETYS